MSIDVRAYGGSGDNMSIDSIDTPIPPMVFCKHISGCWA